MVMCSQESISLRWIYIDTNFGEELGLSNRVHQQLLYHFSKMSLAHNSMSEPVAEKDFALELEAFSDAVFSVKQAWKDVITSMQSSYPIEAGSLQVGYKVNFQVCCQAGSYLKSRRIRNTSTSSISARNLQTTPEVLCTRVRLNHETEGRILMSVEVATGFVQTVVADAKDSTASIDDKIESSKDFYTVSTRHSLAGTLLIVVSSKSVCGPCVLG
jgi:hypothetical protein